MSTVRTMALVLATLALVLAAATSRHQQRDNGTAEAEAEAEVEPALNTSQAAPPGHKEGGLPLISDSVFSLIIMLYVLFAFLFVFFLFCWRRGPDRALPGTKVSCHVSRVTCHASPLLLCPGSVGVTLPAAEGGRARLARGHPAHPHRGADHQLILTTP